MSASDSHESHDSADENVIAKGGRQVPSAPFKDVGEGVAYKQVWVDVIMGTCEKPKVWRPKPEQDHEPFTPIYPLPWREKLKPPDKSRPLWWHQATIKDRFKDWMYANVVLIVLVIFMNWLNNGCMVEDPVTMVWKPDFWRIFWFAIFWTFIITPVFVLFLGWSYRNIGKPMYKDWGYSLLSQDYWFKIVLPYQRQIAQHDGADEETTMRNVLKSARQISFTLLCMAINTLIFGLYMVFVFAVRADWGWTTGKSFFLDGWVSMTGSERDTNLWFLGVACVVWIKCAFVTVLHSFVDDLQYLGAHACQHMPRLLEMFACMIVRPTEEERTRLRGKWMKQKFPMIHKFSLLVWNWNHVAHHTYEYVTVEVKIGLGNLLEKTMELRFAWVWLMCNFFMDFMTSGNWSSSQLDFWAFMIVHEWRDSFLHLGRSLPYSQQLPQLPFLSDFGLIPGWDRAIELHNMHHWGPSHLSNLSNQGFWDFMLGTDTCYGYDMGVWNGVYLNELDKLTAQGLRFYEFGWYNERRDAKWAKRLGGKPVDDGDYSALEDGVTKPDPSWKPAKHIKTTMKDGKIETEASYKVPLLDKSHADDEGEASGTISVKSGKETRYCSRGIPVPEIYHTLPKKCIRYKKNMRWTDGMWGIMHRAFVYAIVAFTLFAWVIAVYHSATCSDPSCGD